MSPDGMYDGGTERKRGIAVWRCMCVALVLILHSVPAVNAERQLPAGLQESFARGVEALRGGRLDEAEHAFLGVLREGGKVAFVYNNLGIVYQQRGDHQKAVLQFREAIGLEPAYAAPHALMGASLLALGQLAEATRHLERAVKLVPKEPLARLQLARAYERGGNIPGMVQQYRALCEVSPSDPEYAYQLGRAYRRLSEWSLKQLIRINPRSARLYQALGQHYLLQEKTDLAVLAFQQAAQGDPELPEIHLALAHIYLVSGNVDEARKEIERELDIVKESRAAQELKQKLASNSRKSP